MYKKELRKLLVKKSEKFNVKVLAYCIMDNHAYILLFSPQIENIGKYMKSVNTSFARMYNKAEQRVGYVFRDRYLSEPIKNERQLYNCIPYIHYNPAKAKIVDTPDKYKYSSYMDYIEKKGIVTEEVIKLVFGSIVDYIGMFNFIHYGVGEEKEPENKCFKEQRKIEVQKCSTDDEYVKECIRLKKINISNRKIAESLKIGRNKVNKIIKNMCQ